MTLFCRHNADRRAMRTLMLGFFNKRSVASETYLGSISQAMLFRPVFIAATDVVPVPQKGSEHGVAGKENNLISRSANGIGNGAG
jgi:hypothetical protein